MRSFTLRNKLLPPFLRRNGTLDGVVLSSHTHFSPVRPNSELVGVKEGILVAVVISLIDHVRVSYHPPTSLLKLSPAGEFVETPAASYTMALPGLMIYRFEAPLYYANADFFMREVLGLIQNGDPALRWFMVRFSRISDVDYSASKMLEELIHRLQARRLTLVFCDVDEDLTSLLQRYGVLDSIGNDKVFDHLDAAVQKFRHLPPPQAKRP